MSLAAGPGRGRVAGTDDLKLVVDRHVAYVQKLDTVRFLPSTGSDLIFRANITNDSARITGCEYHGRNISCHNTASTNYCTMPNRDTRSYRAIATKPHMVLYGDRTPGTHHVLPLYGV